MTPWKTLLSGSLARKARDHAGGIAEDLRRLERPEEFAPSYGVGVAASLASGAAGLAVTYDALEGAGIATGLAERATSLLESATATMSESEMEPDFFGGFTGIAWAVARLWCGDGSVEEDDLLSDVDVDVLGLLDPPAWSGPYELVSGLVGIGVYALERLPRPAAATLLGRVVDELEARSEARDGGLAWRTRPEHLSPLQRERSPEGHYDLGVAHGVPGIVALLAQSFAAGVAEGKARALLEGAVAWLLARREPAPPRFPYWVGPAGERKPSRSAWCYGDPGVAAVLLLSSRCVGEPAWEREALDLAREAAARPPEDSGVVDASLCHGAAGVAHIFNRIWQRTGDADLGRAAAAWFERTLERKQPGSGYGGYLTSLKSADGTLTFEPDPSLLSGSAGVAAALAAAASPVEPTWDRMLLLSSRFEG